MIHNNIRFITITSHVTEILFCCFNIRMLKKIEEIKFC